MTPSTWSSSCRIAHRRSSALLFKCCALGRPRHGSTGHNNSTVALSGSGRRAVRATHIGADVDCSHRRSLERSLQSSGADGTSASEASRYYGSLPARSPAASRPAHARRGLGDGARRSARSSVGGCAARPIGWAAPQRSTARRRPSARWCSAWSRRPSSSCNGAH